jgi:hypothetical protein
LRRLAAFDAEIWDNAARRSKTAQRPISGEISGRRAIDCVIAWAVAPSASRFGKKKSNFFYFFIKSA